MRFGIENIHKSIKRPPNKSSPNLQGLFFYTLSSTAIEGVELI